MAESTKQSQETNKSISYEETHFLRIANLLITIAPSAVRVKFDKEFHPDVLQKILYQERFKMLESLKKRNILTQIQWDLMFPKSGTTSSSTFDLTLMISLIRHLTPIPVGDILPLTTDISEGADLSRLKYYRNQISHSDTGTLSETDFHQWWTDISEAIQRLSKDRFKQTCNDLKYAKLDQNDKEIPIEIRNIARTNDSITKGVQKLHEMQIQEWESEKIVETRAIKELIHLMTYNNIVLVTGTFGCGKSTALHYVALQFHHDKAYDIIPVCNPEEIKQYFNPDCKQVFVIDDACGTYSIDICKVNRWIDISNDILSMVLSSDIKIIASCRTHISQDRLFKRIEILFEVKCDMISEKLCLTEKERMLIGNIFLSHNDLQVLKTSNENLITKYFFFPLLCNQYQKQKSLDIAKFFSNPDEVIRTELIRLFNAQDQKTIATLIVFIVYNNRVHKKELTKLSGIKIFLEDISDQLHLQSSFSIQVLKSEIHNLKKTYVQKHGETYRIGNEKVFDILVAFCGEKKFDLILDIADADIIRDRFLLRVMTKTIENVSLQDVIHVDEKNERKYFDRLLKDIENGFIEKVFSNRNLNSSLVRKQFVEYIKGKVDFHKVLTHLPQQKLYSLLLSMLHQGYSELVPILLTKDINYNLTNWNGDTPLYTASYKGYTNIVKLLLENNANPNISTWICEKPQNNVKLKYQHDFDDNSKRHHSDRGEVESPSWTTLRKRKCSLDGLFDGSVFQIPHHVIRRYQVTSLYIASKEGYFDIVRLLLEYKADPNVICDSDKVSPLIVSSRKGYTSIVKWLLLYRGDPNRTSCDASKTTPLYEASSEGHTDIVKLLLNHNADHNRRCTWKEDTAMDRAVCNNRIGVVEELLKHKVDCTISNRETKIPLFVAVENNYKEIIDLMLNLSSDVHIRDKFNTMRLYLASKSGDLRTVQELLNQNVDPGNEYNISSLYIASYEGHVDIVNLLLDKNIDTNIVNKENESVLYVAVSRGHTDIVKKLLEHDCNPNICNTDNETPLHIATRLGHTEIVKLLLIHKGDLNVYNNEHQTPLIIAATIGRVEITNLLLEYNCDVNISNNENETPLYIASCRGDMAIAKLLLNYNCDPLISNKDNESPLVKAKSYGHLEIAEMLSEKLNVNNVFYKT
ncbi:Hypothetical predicted protein [Mytilus galloprovincialis]|uniref:DZIP3-like HEPN domain-containing protein n=1 Tax=Mytilus galloprovincialis TaxID=29158 RepID=A0A8B6CA25_MYTGA|nr:Hypothetical predicted protein [Mytilus galloprovincialis]